MKICEVCKNQHIQKNGVNFYNGVDICEKCVIQKFIDKNDTIKDYKAFCNFKKYYSVRDYIEYRRTIKEGFENNHHCNICGKEKDIVMFFVREGNHTSRKIKQAVKEKYKNNQFLVVCKQCKEKIDTPWAKHYESCSYCGTTEISHYGLGYCKDCFVKLFRRKFRYKWSLKYPCCKICGTTDCKHNSGGICIRCYGRIRRGVKSRYKWSRKYERCQKCGTTEIAHHSMGLCKICYRKKMWQKNKKKP